jgi:hypothetical protein
MSECKISYCAVGVGVLAKDEGLNVMNKLDAVRKYSKANLLARSIQSST